MAKRGNHNRVKVLLDFMWTLDYSRTIANVYVSVVDDFLYLE